MVETATDPFTVWLLQYGCFALFFLLALGIIGLPIPEDTLMIFTGILIQKGVLPPVLAFISAFLGSLCGITVSYLIGRFAGDVVIKKYGGYIGLTEVRMAKMHWWFERFGKWVIFIGYFIAGLRHFSGLFAGFTDMEFKHFAKYAVLGALCWIGLLFSFGYFFGECCNHMINYAMDIFENNFTLVLVCLAVIWVVYSVVKNYLSKPRVQNNRKDT